MFEHGGKEYVVVLSAGNVLIGSPHGDSVWLFAVDGRARPCRARGRRDEAMPA